jgi:hypothetical protein
MIDEKSISELMIIVEKNNDRIHGFLDDLEIAVGTTNKGLEIRRLLALIANANDVQSDAIISSIEKLNDSVNRLNSILDDPSEIVKCRLRKSSVKTPK